MRPYKEQRARVIRLVDNARQERTIQAGKKYSLTGLQLRCYIIIRQRLKDKGVAPSRRELQELLGLKSVSGVQRLVDTLVIRGWIEILPNAARAIRLTEAA